MAEQLGFDLPTRTARGRDDFLVTSSNALAAALIDQWPEWAGRKLLLSGPQASGKTHLTHVWAATSGAQIIEATALTVEDVPALATQNIAVENIPQIANDPQAQTALFHLHNLVLAEGHALLLTGTGSIRDWGLALPDLVSRLHGTTEAALQPPDDALLSVVLAKLMHDRQLSPSANLIPYLIPRMDRSFAGAQALVAALDATSLAHKRPLTRALAAQVLDNLGAGAQ